MVLIKIVKKIAMIGPRCRLMLGNRIDLGFFDVQKKSDTFSEVERRDSIIGKKVFFFFLEEITFKKYSFIYRQKKVSLKWSQKLNFLYDKNLYSTTSVF